MAAANRAPFRYRQTTTAGTENKFHDFLVPASTVWEISQIRVENSVAHASNFVNVVHDSQGEGATCDSNTSTTLVDTGAFAGDDWVQFIVTNDVAGFEYMVITSHDDDALTGVWEDAGDPTAAAPAYTIWLPAFDEYNNFEQLSLDPHGFYGRPLVLEAAKTLRVIYGRGGASTTCTTTIFGHTRDV